MVGKTPSNTTRARDGLMVVAALGALISANACAEISSTSTSASSADATSTSTGSSMTGTSGAGGMGSGPGGLDEERVREVLDSLATDVIAPTYKLAATTTGELEAGAGTLASQPTEANYATVREQWRDAMAAWQMVEMMQIGPAGSSEFVAGGADARDEIYSWPLVNPCRVDQEIVEGNYADSGAFKGEAINVRGYDALERLLFETGTKNACTVINPINEKGEWDLIVGDLPSRRAAYAKTLTVILKGQVGDLASEWDGGPWIKALGEAGVDTSVYPTAVSGLNAISDAIFYFEKITKDQKLGRALGIIDCSEDTCPDAFESPYAGADKAHIKANIKAMRMLLLGSEDGLGFADLLEDRGAGSIATNMAAGLDEADAAIDAVTEPSLKEALAKNVQSVQDIHDAVKKVTDVLKTDFVTSLGLELPKSVQSDND